MPVSPNAVDGRIEQRLLGQALPILRCAYKAADTCWPLDREHNQGPKQTCAEMQHGQYQPWITSKFTSSSSADYTDPGGIMPWVRGTAARFYAVSNFSVVTPGVERGHASSAAATLRGLPLIFESRSGHSYTPRSSMRKHYGGHPNVATLRERVQRYTYLSRRFCKADMRTLMQEGLQELDTIINAHHSNTIRAFEAGKKSQKASEMTSKPSIPGLIDESAAAHRIDDSAPASPDRAGTSTHPAPDSCYIPHTAVEGCCAAGPNRLATHSQWTHERQPGELSCLGTTFTSRRETWQRTSSHDDGSAGYGICPVPPEPLLAALNDHGRLAAVRFMRPAGGVAPSSGAHGSGGVPSSMASISGAPSGGALRVIAPRSSAPSSDAPRSLATSSSVPCGSAPSSGVPSSCAPSSCAKRNNAFSSGFTGCGDPWAASSLPLPQPRFSEPSHLSAEDHAANSTEDPSAAAMLRSPGGGEHCLGPLLLPPRALRAREPATVEEKLDCCCPGPWASSPEPASPTPTKGSSFLPQSLVPEGLGYPSGTMNACLRPHAPAHTAASEAPDLATRPSAGLYASCSGTAALALSCSAYLQGTQQLTHRSPPQAPASEPQLLLQTPFPLQLDEAARGTPSQPGLVWSGDEGSGNVPHYPLGSNGLPPLQLQAPLPPYVTIDSSSDLQGRNLEHRPAPAPTHAVGTAAQKRECRRGRNIPSEPCLSSAFQATKAAKACQAAEALPFDRRAVGAPAGPGLLVAKGGRQAGTAVLQAKPPDMSLRTQICRARVVIAFGKRVVQPAPHPPRLLRQQATEGPDEKTGDSSATQSVSADRMLTTLPPWHGPLPPGQGPLPQRGAVSCYIGCIVSNMSPEDMAASQQQARARAHVRHLGVSRLHC